MICFARKTRAYLTWIWRLIMIAVANLPKVESAASPTLKTSTNTTKKVIQIKAFNFRLS
jgi:hypothetical protein